MAVVPALVKHMTLAILRRAELDGSNAEKFHAAFAIARRQCAKFKLIGAEGADNPTALTLTKDGATRDAAHRREPDSFSKCSRFDVLAARYGLVPPTASATTPPPAVPTAPSPPVAPPVPTAPPARARWRER